MLNISDFEKNWNEIIERQMQKISINGVKINYVSLGEGSAITMLHGYTGSIRDWISQIPILAERYRIVAMDHRGHGNSDAPSSSKSYFMDIFTGDVYNLLKNLKIDETCLIGHSMGGFMALDFVLDNPEMVDALVLVDTSSGDWERDPEYEKIRKKVEELARTEGMEAAFEYNAVHNKMIRERFEGHPELRQISKEKMLQTSVDGYIHVGHAIGNWEPVTNRLNEIEVPTLVIVGEEDNAFLQSSQVLEESVPNAELVKVEGATHNPHEEKPEAFNEVLMDFLDRNF